MGYFAKKLPDFASEDPRTARAGTAQERDRVG